MSAPLLTMSGIRKEYPGVVALDGVDLEVRPGEIHCLLGENGAGKSTLMNILAGATPADAGRIVLDGREVALRTPSDAFRHGIGMIYQDPMLVGGLSVAENILLGQEPGSWLIDREGMKKRASDLLGRLGMQPGRHGASGGAGPDLIDPDEPAAHLTPGHRQITAIARALSRDVRVLILDEPSVSLTAHELQNLFLILRRLRDAGTGIIYITHRLEEIFALGDRITVLRDGGNIGCLDVAGATRAGLIRMMAGREAPEGTGRRTQPHVADVAAGAGAGLSAAAPELLRVERLCGGMLEEVTFSLAKGEVLGVAGLAGSGRTTLGRLIFGATTATAGRMQLDGREHSPRTPIAGIGAGVGYLPGDRNHDGLVPDLSLRENMMLAGGKKEGNRWTIDRVAETELCRSYMQSLDIAAPSTETRVSVLSGGNKQKVILARWLMTNSRLLIFDEPTAGIDVGVKFEFHRIIGRLAAEGRGVIVLSSDLPELFAVCGRILVLAAGRPAGIVDAASSTQEEVVALATGEGVS